MERNQKIQDELIEISSIVANIPFVNVYSISSDYFDCLSNNISKNLNKETNEHLQLHGIKEKNTYQVPHGYFEAFSDNLIKTIKTKDNIRVLKKQPVRYFKFALAACFISLLGFFVYQYLPKKQNNELDKNTALLIKEANLIINKGSFENEINEIDEKDLVKYLQEGGQDVDAALVASLDDETQFYENEINLYDGETLTKYMNELNIQHSNYNNN